MTVRIINSDVMEGLRQLPDESAHCVVTSPPYFGLRDYGVEGQIGLEPTPAAFVARMVGVFAEVRRVLRSDGTCWLNLGDSYCNSDKWGGGAANTGKHVRKDGSLPSGAVRRKWAGIDGIKPKDLMGMPWRVAFALQADGWWLRSDIIWSKPNPMPESVTDRPTKAHEYIFLLTKSERYFYDHEAIKETALWPDGTNFTRKAGNKSHKYVDQYEADDTEQHRTKAGLMKIADVEWASRNKRSVWTIATCPFPEAHFATFPPELPEICIKAGCPVGGIVLDPFAGAGTTGLVADRLQRSAILIELNREYAAMAERRIMGDAPLFVEVA